MGVALRPAVLDDGSSAQNFCIQSGTTKSTSGVVLAYKVFSARTGATVQLQANASSLLVKNPVHEVHCDVVEDVLMIMGKAGTGHCWLGHRLSCGTDTGPKGP